MGFLSDVVFVVDFLYLFPLFSHNYWSLSLQGQLMLFLQGFQQSLVWGKMPFQTARLSSVKKEATVRGPSPSWPGLRSKCYHWKLPQVVKSICLILHVFSYTWKKIEQKDYISGSVISGLVILLIGWLKVLNMTRFSLPCLSASPWLHKYLDVSTCWHSSGPSA